MALTPEQLQLLKADILANPDLNSQPNQVYVKGVYTTIAS